ncbi:MAG TPA: signal peptidase I [Thermoanaerobaculia bacterium]|jgi:signal peptidase I|nr:signal peptidase I [Thermoanaerobaculia bacterium]
MAEERSIWREYLEALIIAAVFLLFTNTFVIQTFYIPSQSMEDTLLVGDHLFVNRFIFGPTATALEKKLLPFRPVRRGDIVVFRSPKEPTLDLVKRCIAVGGDTVQVIDQQLYINGETVDDKSYALHKGSGFLDAPPMRDNFGPEAVPPGNYFCMGDNRDNSYDSRFWGPLPAHFVKGRALFIYWSYGGRTSTGQWEGIVAKLRDLAETAIGFFSKTRWERTFRLIR